MDGRLKLNSTCAFMVTVTRGQWELLHIYVREDEREKGEGERGKMEREQGK